MVRTQSAETKNYRDARMVKTSPLVNAKSPFCWASKGSSATNFFSVAIFGTLHTYLHQYTQNWKTTESTITIHIYTVFQKKWRQNSNYYNYGNYGKYRFRTIECMPHLKARRDRYEPSSYVLGPLSQNLSWCRSPCRYLELPNWCSLSLV